MKTMPPEPVVPSQSEEASHTGAKNGFGAMSLTCLVIASMVGTGVFTTSGYTLGAVGSPARVLLCWSIGGLIAICGSVAYGRLAEVLPASGGEYLYLTKTVHPAAGFLAGWVSLTAGFSGAIATAAVAFESYAVPDSIRPAWLPPDLVAISVVLVCGLLHSLHRSAGTWFQNFVVCLKVAVLVFFLSAAVTKLGNHEWHTTVYDPQPTGFDLITAIATSVVWISMSYAGFNAAVYVASEASAPTRQVPRSLLLGTIGVTVLYLVLNLIFVTAVPREDLIWQEDVAAIAARALGGAPLDQMVRAAVCFGLFTSVSGMIMSGPRVYARMADDNVFPGFFRAERNGISRSICLQTGIAIGLIVLQRVLVELQWISTPLLGLLIYLGTTLSLSSATCVATMFLPSFRRQYGALTNTRLICSLAYVLATFAAIVLLILNHKDQDEWLGVRHLSGVAATIVTGLVAWTFFGRSPAKS